VRAGVSDKFYYFIRVKGWNLSSDICMCSPKEESSVFKRELNLRFDRKTLRAVGNLLLISVDWQKPNSIGN